MGMNGGGRTTTLICFRSLNLAVLICYARSHAFEQRRSYPDPTFHPISSRYAYISTSAEEDQFLKEFEEEFQNNPSILLDSSDEKQKRPPAALRKDVFALLKKHQRLDGKWKAIMSR